jgi:hypothetical protein
MLVISLCLHLIYTLTKKYLDLNNAIFIGTSLFFIDIFFNVAVINDFIQFT